MNTPGSAVVSTIKCGGNEFKSLNNLSYEPDSFVGNNLDDETASTRVHGAAEHPLLGGAHRHRRADQARQGLVLCRLQPFQDRQGNLGRAAAVQRPRRVRQLHRQGQRTTESEGHAGRLLPVGPEVQAAPRPVGLNRARFDPRAGQPIVDVQRPVAARLDEPPVQRSSRSDCSGLAGRWRRRSTGTPIRRASIPAPPSRPVRAGRRAMPADRSPSIAPNPRSTGLRPTSFPRRRAATTSSSATSTPTTSRSSRATALPGRSCIAS